MLSSDTHLSYLESRDKHSSDSESTSQPARIHGTKDNSNTSQRSPTVFLAKITVAPQELQQNHNNLSHLQPADDASNGNHAGSNSESSTNGLGSRNHKPLNSDATFLCVDLNDIVSIEQHYSDEEWFLAKSDQQVGRISKSSCCVLDEQISNGLCHYLIDNQYFNLNVCFASFVAQDVGDLSITKGDIIVAIAPINEHWMQGQVCYHGQAGKWPNLTPGKDVGTFPLNHCWQLDTERVKTFCYNKLEREKKQKVTRSSNSHSILTQQIPGWSVTATQPSITSNIEASRKPFLSIAHSSSLSSGSSSLYSTDFNQANIRNDTRRQQQQLQQQSSFNSLQKIDLNNGVQNMANQPPPRPNYLPQRISDRQKSSSDRAVSSKPSGLLSNRQQDKLKGWIHTVKKKTARLSTRITASLGLISLARDEEFERHYESFKQLEKSIRGFIKNLTQFVEHFEDFLVALQNTSDNLADFYRDKSYQKEINEMKKKSKALNCEHFHAFKRTVDRQVIAVASQLLQKFAGPHQLVHKRSTKLLDYVTKTKEIESHRDLDKKASLREDYVIAKDLYERINGQLIEELPLFNQFALDIFKECILVLLESRRNLMLAYMQQTANLLDTPLMASYTASDVASTILMSCELATHMQPPTPPSTAINSNALPVCKASCSDARSISNQGGFKSSGPTSELETEPSGSKSERNHGGFSRPQSAMSHFSSEFDQMAIAAREISSTPLSQLSEIIHDVNNGGDLSDTDDHVVNNDRFDEPDSHNRYEHASDGSSDNKHNENIESTIQASRSANNKLCSSQAPNGLLPDKSNKDRKKGSKHPIFIASWPFVATGPNQLSIACNQALKLIKDRDECGNPDWSLVKNKKGQLGYVPSSYIKPKE